MLQAIRDKTSGWIAYLIIGLISVPFALWGINSYLGGGEQQPAAIVDGDEISARQLDYAYARYRERLSSVFGGQIPEIFSDESTLKEQVLSQIIEERALLNYIRDKGYRVGDIKLFENIRSMPIFQQDGRFSKELYQNQLASQGSTPTLFEQELRRSQEMGQLNMAIKTSAMTLPVQLDLFNRLQNQSRKIRTLTVKNQYSSISVSEQEITDYYNEQSARYMDPARIKVDYIELNLDNIRQSIQISEDRLLDRYDQLHEQLTTTEIRTASHILLSVSKDDDEEVVKQKITDLKKRIDQGEDFSQLAIEFSQDPGSAKDGGDLGEVERDMMVKPFETALFALQVGELSEPVKTKFGWHLIKLKEVSGGETQSFAQVRSQIEQEARTEMAESQIYDLAENLANIGYEQPDSLLPASDQLGLTIQTTDWFSHTKGKDLAEQEKIRQIAFSDDVLNQNRNSETIELADNRIVIMHLNSHEPAKKQSLETVKEAITDTLKKTKGREQAQQTGKKFLTDLRGGEEMGSIANSLSAAIIDEGFVRRGNTTVERDVLSTAFSLAKPTTGQLVYEGITEADGDYTLIELSEIGTDEAQASDKPAANDAAKTMNDASANYEYQALLKVLTEQADVIRTPVIELQ